MRLVYATIELSNSKYVGLKALGQITKDQIRKLDVKALVDSDAYMLCINESVRAQLGLWTIKRDTAQLAYWLMVELDIVGPVEVAF